MTLKEFLESGIVLEGLIKIQCWENEDVPTIYYEGFSIYYEGFYGANTALEECMDREITYIFPYNPTPFEPGICIELAED